MPKLDANKPHPEVQKVGDFYASGMDEKDDRRGARRSRSKDELKRIDAIKDRTDLLKEIAHLHTHRCRRILRFHLRPGRQEQHAWSLRRRYQGGLGLPDRDYYTKDDDASKKLRDAYVEHVTKMLTLLGEPPSNAAEHAKKIMALETSLAKPSRTRVELRDPQKNYNKMTQADLQKLMPDWNWADYFKEINLAEPGRHQCRPA